MFKDDAFLEEGDGAARGRARHVRPELRRLHRGQADAAQAAPRLQGAAGREAYSLRTFHDKLLAQGAAPFWAHRQLMLGERGRRPARLIRRQNTACRSTSTVASLRTPVREDPEFSDDPDHGVPVVRRGAGREAALLAGDPVQGVRLVHHRLRAEGRRGRDARVDGQRIGEGDGLEGRLEGPATSKPTSRVEGRPNRARRRRDSSSSSKKD